MVCQGPALCGWRISAPQLSGPAWFQSVWLAVGGSKKEFQKRRSAKSLHLLNRLKRQGNTSVCVYIQHCCVGLYLAYFILLAGVFCELCLVSFYLPWTELNTSRALQFCGQRSFSLQSQMELSQRRLPWHRYLGATSQVKICPAPGMCPRHGQWHS